MSKKKAIAFGLKTAQNPRGFAGVMGVFLEIIIGTSILMLLMSPLFIWMYGFEAIIGYAIIIGILLVIGLFIFYEPKKSKLDNPLTKNEKKVIETRRKLYGAGSYRRCPECTSIVDMDIGVCRFCGYDLINKEFKEIKRSPEEQSKLDYAKKLQKQRK